jgi:hypothetical protein
MMSFVASTFWRRLAIVAAAMTLASGTAACRKRNTSRTLGTAVDADEPRKIAEYDITGREPYEDTADGRKRRPSILELPEEVTAKYLIVETETESGNGPNDKITGAGIDVGFVFTGYERQDFFAADIPDDPKRAGTNEPDPIAVRGWVRGDLAGANQTRYQWVFHTADGARPSFRFLQIYATAFDPHLSTGVWVYASDTPPTGYLVQHVKVEQRAIPADEIDTLKRLLANPQPYRWPMPQYVNGRYAVRMYDNSVPRAEDGFIFKFHEENGVRQVRVQLQDKPYLSQTGWRDVNSSEMAHASERIAYANAITGGQQYYVSPESKPGQPPEIYRRLGDQIQTPTYAMRNPMPMDFACLPDRPVCVYSDESIFGDRIILDPSGKNLLLGHRHLTGTEKLYVPTPK